MPSDRLGYGGAVEDPRAPFRVPPLRSESASSPEDQREPGAGRATEAGKQKRTVRRRSNRTTAGEGHDVAARAPKTRRRRLLALTFVVVLATFLVLNLSLAGQGRDDGAAGLPRSLSEAVNRLRGPVRVGLQIGHFDAADQPEELATLRASTGAHAGGVNEVDVNAAIVDALAKRLASHGFIVDVLGATIPPHYRADLVLAVHADANLDATRNGYKSAHFTPARNEREALLKLDVDRAVLLATTLGDDDRNVSGNMLEYYAFNHRRFRHAVARRTPALLVEMGYLSNPADLRLLLEPNRIAAVLEQGLLRYLHDVGRVDDAPAP